MFFLHARVEAKTTLAVELASLVARPRAHHLRESGGPMP
jgi:hypothetical protein